MNFACNQCHSQQNNASYTVQIEGKHAASRVLQAGLQCCHPSKLASLHSGWGQDIIQSKGHPLHTSASALLPRLRHGARQ
jgi:hypothetical protein